MTDSDLVDSVSRKQAKSGKVEYGDPVILSENSKSRVVMVPFFIPHTDHGELSVKIQTFRKAAVPGDVVLLDDKSVTLPESALLKLNRALEVHLAVAKGPSTGEYFVVRVAEASADTSALDPSSVASALVGVLAQPEIIEHLQGVELTGELSRALKNSIRLSEMRDAVASLRVLLGTHSEESFYQKWCESHSWVFGNSYVVSDKVRNISISDRVDLLLPRLVAEYRDIVELKRPNMTVLRYDSTHRDYYFSQHVSLAIGQCHRYLDVFSKAASSGLPDHAEILSYHPRATIVIGRSDSWGTDQQRALHGLNSRMSGITVMTYDQLLAQGERTISVLSEIAENELDTVDEYEDSDEPPF